MLMHPLHRFFNAQDVKRKFMPLDALMWQRCMSLQHKFLNMHEESGRPMSRHVFAGKFGGKKKVKKKTDSSCESRCRPNKHRGIQNHVITTKFALKIVLSHE